jgi:hypothetical protein
MRIAVNFLIGLMFGLGLIVAGMVDPAKVQNFLDIAGSWDPSLAFVMAGAIAVTSAGYWLVRRLRAPLLEPAFQFPTRHDIDAQLIGGAVLFGVGWGLGGLCPGPALVALPLAAPGTLAFVPAMLAGVVAGTVFVRSVLRPRAA